MTISSKTIRVSDNPLFSCIITLYTVILLYFPLALKLSISLVFTLTFLLLLFLLRLGAGQTLRSQTPESKECFEGERQKVDNQLTEAGNSEFSTLLEKWVPGQSKTVLAQSPNPDFEESFVEWDVRAPLEVIYEAYEGEEDPNYETNIDSDSTRFVGLERHPSLSMYYPETDSDSSCGGEFTATGERGSPERVCFEWDEEIREGLFIEIALDAIGKKDSGPDFNFEEDNLIEIDISPNSGQECFL